MPNSVNTNIGAMIALQNLNQTNADLMTTQNRINTGKKVASAKDNGAIWAIAQNQRATSSSLNAVKDSLQRSQSTVDVAIAGGEAVSDLLVQMKEKALAASDTSLDSASRTALNDDFIALRDQVQKSVDNATFNGVNMIKNLGTTIAALRIVASPSARASNCDSEARSRSAATSPVNERKAGFVQTIRPSGSTRQQAAAVYSPTAARLTARS